MLLLISVSSVQAFTHLFTKGTVLQLHQSSPYTALTIHPLSTHTTSPATSSQQYKFRYSSISFIDDGLLKNKYQRPFSNVVLSMGKKSTQQLLTRQWLPSMNKSDDDIFASDVKRETLEKESIEYLAKIIRGRLQFLKNQNQSNGDTNEVSCDQYENDEKNHDSDHSIKKLVQGRFRDLTCNLHGEKVLEGLFMRNPPDESIQSDKDDVIRASVIALQSLLIMGMQVGVKGSAEYQQKLVSHLHQRNDMSISSSMQQNLEKYFNKLSARQLKHQVDTTAGTQLLSVLKRKRSTQSAFDLLVQLGAWEKHEDIVLLRSGFPLRFTDEEIDAALDAEFGFMGSNGTRIENTDPDEILGLRRDLRALKVYTIDSKHTNEIDDGLSIETVMKADGSQKHRVWIHIADADKWAPRSSRIFKAAQSRATSVYTPTGSISMFPPNLSSGAMSLRADRDSFALSLCVEINGDGSIDESSIQVMPSIIRVDYRLTYEEVDEMLEMGVGYFEEWELGALLSEANKRRNFRITNGSTEGFVPMPIPKAEIRVETNEEAQDGIDIVLKIEASHNAGVNQSAILLETNPSNIDEYAPPVSSSFLLVTEMMILSGEAMGKFRKAATKCANQNLEESVFQLENSLDLPYRTQSKPDFRERYQELNTLESLRERGYCHAWYARRFFKPVRVLKEAKPHYGLGLDCYVQWSSPIRRFGDLQVHAAVKRYLRKERINQMLQEGKAIPLEISDLDIGCPIPILIEKSMREKQEKMVEYSSFNKSKEVNSDFNINYDKGLGYVKAARMVQRKTTEYWMFEYIRRLVEISENDLEFEATVLACIDPERYQYVIYVNELGLEHRYLSQKGYLQTGSKLLMKVDSVSPRHGLLTFSLSTKYIGRGAVS